MHGYVEHTQNDCCEIPFKTVLVFTQKSTGPPLALMRFNLTQKNVTHARGENSIIILLQNLYVQQESISSNSKKRKRKNGSSCGMT